MANQDRTGGRIVVDAFRRHGVEHVFCVPGESYLDILDALLDASHEIRLVSARQEGGAAYMAESYAKLTGKPGVCLVARSPGACNASIAIHTAYQDGTPMVVIAGQIRRNFWGRGSFQEIDLARMLEPMTKWAVQVERAADLPYYMAQAFRVAQEGRPGPVVLVTPEDMLAERTSAGDMPVLQVHRQAPDPRQMQEMRALLDRAERPILYVGGSGWTAAAKKGLQQFAEANGLPVCCAFRRLDAFDHDHPNFAGEMGPAAAPELVKRVKESDVVLAPGTRLGEHATQGYTLFDAPVPKQKLIHVLEGAHDFGRVFQPTLAIQADMELFVNAANAQKPGASAAGRAAQVAEARRQYEQNLDPSRSPKGAVDLGRCMVELDKRLTSDAILTSDAGHYTGWVQRFLRLNGGRRFLAPVSGAMGYSVPSAVMAKIVQPKRMAVGLVGDGGFGMTGNEIATAAACGAAPIIVIFNNGMLGSIRAWQEISYPGRVSGTDLMNPDYVRIAEAHGGFGARVERTEDFVPAFENAARSGKLAVLDLRMDREAITTRVTLTDIREAALKRKGGAG
ncbi:MAG: thiamine pyrophosphate-binding protein [Betaproteobacteria bacterium]|nr:MAG: thiamine pyrophosphate-binding protein [Betaproteobacteria bacterium]